MLTPKQKAIPVICEMKKKIRARAQQHPCRNTWLIRLLGSVTVSKCAVMFVAFNICGMDDVCIGSIQRKYLKRESVFFLARSLQFQDRYSAAMTAI